MSECTFRVHGLCCGSEVRALKQEVGPRWVQRPSDLRTPAHSQSIRGNRYL
jgi:hypothetical protein